MLTVAILRAMAAAMLAGLILAVILLAVAAGRVAGDLAPARTHVSLLDEPACATRDQARWPCPATTVRAAR